MNAKLIGLLYLSTYILFVGVGSFLQKFVMRQLNAYHINFLMAIGMVVITIPALLLTQKNLAIPVKGLPLGLLSGFLMAAGSVAYVLSLSKLPVGMAAAISSSYLVIVAILSWIFLREAMPLLKIIGLSLTVIGVAILSMF